MYSKEGTITDRREMLKVKLKSLAAEARIIRQMEQRTWGPLQTELYRHRIDVVRTEARHTSIAYALIRGVPLEVVETPNSRPYSTDRVAVMLKKYGPKELTRAAKEAICVYDAEDLNREAA